MEPASDFEMVVTKPDFGNTSDTFYSNYATLGLSDDTVNPPTSVPSKPTAHSFGHRLESLSDCYPPECQYQELASVADLSYECTELPVDRKLSCHSFDPQPQGDVSELHYPFSLDTASFSNIGIIHPSDTSLSLVEDQAQDKGSISPSNNDSLCECADNSCTDLFNTYSSGGGGMHDAHSPITRKACLTPSYATLRNDQASPHKCDYASPVTGETCSAILRVYDCSRHKKNNLSGS